MGGRGPGRPTLPTSLGWAPLPGLLWEESMLHMVGATMGLPRTTAGRDVPGDTW